MGTLKRTAWCALALLCLLLPTRVHALEPGAQFSYDTNRESVDAFFGAFTWSVPIEVPAFHGLEPRVAITYASASRHNGQEGVGGGLSGWSTIERASVGKGTPKYAAGDIYLLDGVELVASTALGGTHATKTQSFRRITLSGANWLVWERDGTKSTYTPMFTVGSNTYRWGLSSVVDTFGNTVTYSWTCTGGDCYPNQITYDGYSVVATWATRTDQPTFATGGTALGKTVNRLSTIQVKAGTTLIRKYTVTYGATASTAQSVMTKVQQAGKDGTTTLPGTTFGWPTEWAGGFNAGQADTMTNASGELLMADVNGDGKADAIEHWNGKDVWVHLSNGDGTFGAGTYTSMANPSGELFMGDANGDGKADLFEHWAGKDVWVHLSNGNGTFGAGTHTIMANASGDLLLGDANGDGKDDLFEHWNGKDVWVHLSNGNGTFGAGTYTSMANASGELILGDVNGDGRDDLVEHWNGYQMWVHLSNGNGTFGAGTYTALANTSGELFMADMNGDGRADAVEHWSGYQVWIHLSNGNGTFAAGVYTALANSSGELRLADVNGDGRADVIEHWSGYQVWVHLSDGAGGLKTGVYTAMANSSGELFMADVNGDGRADAVEHWAGASLWTHLAGATTQPSFVATSVGHGYGATTTVTYKPSSAWTNTNNPPLTPTVATIATNDGRGIVRTTTYTYSGGNWDAADRRFLGFRYQKSADTSGAYREVYFYQGAAYSVGEIEDVYYKTSAGGVMERQYRTVANPPGVTNAAPYQRLLLQDDRYECSGDATCKNTRIAYTYNGYGQATQKIEHGDVAVTGDERGEYTTYYPNTTTYVVARPADVVQRAGTTTAGALVAEQRTYYDAAALATPPVKGAPTRTELWLGGEARWLASTATYDAYGNRLTETNPRGATTSYAYDATYHLYPVSATDPLGHVATKTWDYLCGLELTDTDANLRATTRTYDTLCRQTQESTPDGGYTKWSYVNVGTPTTQYVLRSVSDGTANDLWDKTFFDGLNRPYLTEAEPATGTVGYKVTTTYDTRGLTASTSAPYASGETAKLTTFTYDAIGRKTQETRPDASTRKYLYGDWSMTVCDELGKPRSEFRDGYGRVKQVREYTGKTCVLAPACTVGTDCFDTTIGYDLLDNVVTVTDAKALVATATFDTAGRKTQMTDPDLGTWRYAYDDAGNLTSQTDARGQTLTMAYDLLGRRTTTTVAATGAVVSTLAYDQAGHGDGVGRMTSMTDLSGSTSWSWDSMGQETSKTQVIGGTAYTIGRSYDAAGRPATVTYPDGEVVTYAYAPSGKLSGMSSPLGSYVSGASFDARGGLTTRTLGNGVVETFTRDAKRFWVTAATARLGTTTLHDLTIGRNLRGETTARSSTASPQDVWTYAYDDLGRLTTATNTPVPAWSETFAYDAVGRLTSQTSTGAYTYSTTTGPKHAPSVAGSLGALSYDANGNLIAGNGHAVTIDAQNRAVTVDGATMVYDGEGQRVRAGSKTFVEDLYEVDGATATKYYYFGKQQIARRDAALYFYHGDQVGSALTITSSTGGVVARRVYSPYGRQLSSTGSLFDPFGFAGQRLDPSGLYQMGARAMAPTIAMFTSPDVSAAPDPSDPQSLNRFAYARNSPTNLVDPTGFEEEMPAIYLDGSEDSYDLLVEQIDQGLVPLIFVPGILNPEGSDNLANNLESVREILASNGYGNRPFFYVQNDNGLWGAFISRGGEVAAHQLTDALKVVDRLDGQVDVLAHSNGNATTATVLGRWSGESDSHWGTIRNFLGVEPNLNREQAATIAAFAERPAFYVNINDPALAVSLFGGTLTGAAADAIDGRTVDGAVLGRGEQAAPMTHDMLPNYKLGQQNHPLQFRLGGQP